MGGEGDTPPMSHDIQTTPEMAAILKNVEEITVYGKFAKSFPIVRRLREKPPVEVIVKGGNDYNEYGYEKVSLRGDRAGLVDIMHSMVLHDRGSGLTASLKSDSQFLIVDTMQDVDDNPHGRKAKDFAVVSYTFEQDASVRDSGNRPLGAVGVRALLPHQQTNQLLELLKRDPDAIEGFYHGIADGIEEGVKRVRSDRLTVIDLRDVPEKDRRTILAAQMHSSSLQCQFASALELQGRIPRLTYKKDNHGTADPQTAYRGIARVSAEERDPRVDVAAGQTAYVDTMKNMRDIAKEDQGGIFSRFRRGGY